MTDAVIDGGTLYASLDDDRSVEGLLVPFGEEGRSNLGRFAIGTGAFSIPDDVPNTVGWNVDHRREQVIGRATVLRETPDGIRGRFTFARTPEGDAAHEDFRAGRRRHLSVEVADVRIRGGQAVGGRIFGAALVAEPAFPSATLLAAAADLGTDEVELPGPAADPEPERLSGEVTETTKTETLPDGRKRITRTTVTITEPTPEDQTADGTKEGTAVTEATVPPTLLGRFTGNAAPAPTAEPVLLASLHEAGRTQDRTLLARVRDEATPGLIFAALAEAHRTQDRTLLAALTDVAITGAGTPGAAIVQPQWLGQLWRDKEYQRRYVPLFRHADLTSFELTGWRWGTKPTMARWTGNKANVPSGAITTTAATPTQAQRYAGAHDVAREYRDFAVTEFWDNYFTAMTESYARLTDEDTLTAVLDEATAVTPGTVPTGIAAAAAYITDGALAILDTATPTFALVAPDLWRAFVLTPKDKVLEYLSASLGLEDGTLAGFRLLPSAELTAGSVLVGSSSAATVYELGQTPLRVEGLDMVKGGIDPGLFGYAATVVNNPAALALVAPGA